MDEPDVGVGRDARVVLYQQTGEGRREALTRLHPPALGLQAGEGVLVLPPPGRQVTTETGGRPSGACCEAVHVERVGRPRDHRGRAREHAPRGRARLGEVLPHRDRRAEPVAVKGPDVQVLAHVQLVGAQRPGGRERDVVGVHDVDLTVDRSVVEHLDVPRPRGDGRVEGEGHPPSEVGVGPSRDDQGAALDAGGGARPGSEHRPVPPRARSRSHSCSSPGANAEGACCTSSMRSVPRDAGAPPSTTTARRPAVRLEDPRRPVGDRRSSEARRRRARRVLPGPGGSTRREHVGSAHSPTIPAPNSSMPMTGRSAFSTSGVLNARRSTSLPSTLPSAPMTMAWSSER